MRDGETIRARPDWHEYFLKIAEAVSSRSTCIRRRYGAVIVKDNVIVGTGYNGSPRGDVNCCDAGFCERDARKVPKGERYELCKAVHAEQNAIINGDPAKMRGAAIYIAGFNDDGSAASGQPCLLCRRMIQNAMISEVIYRLPDGELVKCTPAELVSGAERR